MSKRRRGCCGTVVSILVLILDNTKSVLPCNLFFSKACGFFFFFFKSSCCVIRSVVGMVSQCLGTENIRWHMLNNELRISASSYLYAVDRST